MEQHRLLVVDDNEAIHKDFQKILGINQTSDGPLNAYNRLFKQLEQENSIETPLFDMDSAYQGEEALELVSQACSSEKPYALAFVDIRMPPGWDGIYTIKQLWEVDPHLQVVICTAYSDYSFDEIYQQLQGSDNFIILKKPFDIIEIRQLASTMTKKWSLAKQAREYIALSEEKLAKNYEELKGLYNELQSTQSQLVQHSKLVAIGQLAAGIAHEINNPIAYVASNTKTLSDYTEVIKLVLKNMEHQLNQTQEAAELKNYWQQLTKEKNLSFILEDIADLIKESGEGLRRVSEIVNDLKFFSHTDEGEMQKANINECIDVTLKMIWNELKYKCTVKKEYGDLPAITCNPRQLNQVFMNLLVNAGQAIVEQGEITITTGVEGNHVFIAIKDTGSGISPENMEKLFDPFFTTKPVGTGTGLGLSISYNIVQKHEGQIKVASKEGEGTTFTVYIPMKE
ncbi:hybrid sensor histidine kinase/response regulator [Legionella taurinensis]|uniref:histidine kinase n=1 Tax=Legionella taurinensis TaxID=70611 RepID=A0AB38N5I6_9GAMM|nr:ATP-binding protein [Legionella taurinensis]MDX1837275.1 ATP-binding protein [Legionella taurinensis]PUT40254.1 hybrid sensor histidine kinase/response regulator [Legionella taurinensis]PUT41488.1 hybrid sensor histidine kinase/response regulator [Legionella taurinensis]PUT44354.1 hybrid sensor histidine kinase/response regulator [Legionella taurinensis]PUT48316.1 hybrid sensor histidine kinase/response regulator [Legionella taurinensis]